MHGNGNGLNQYVFKKYKVNILKRNKSPTDRGQFRTALECGWNALHCCTELNLKWLHTTKKRQQYCIKRNFERNTICHSI